MKQLETIYIDVMLDGYFYKQLLFTHDKTQHVYRSQLHEYVLQRYPSLKGKNYEIEISNQRVISK